MFCVEPTVVGGLDSLGPQRLSGIRQKPNTRSVSCKWPGTGRLKVVEEENG
jgi:hypothetical protein